MPRSDPSSRRSTAIPDGRAILIATGLIVLCWLLLMPPGSGPDEPGHLVRAGAVARGELGDRDVYTLPDDYRVAEPGCYAFQPTVAASCAITPERTGDSVELPTRAGEYPIWGHLVVGAPTVLPGLEPIWWARLTGGLIAALLVGWSLASATRVGPAAGAGILLGVTPMAWSTFGTVNPSTIAIAGAVALWTGLLVPRGHGDPTIGVRSTGWLTAIGWAALVLPRRDGLVWACITLVIALAATSRSVPTWWRTLSRAQQITIVAPALVTMVWGALSESRSTRFVVVAPILIAASEAWRWWSDRPSQTAGSRWASGAIVGAVAVLATYVVVGTRPDGWDTDFAIDVAMQTDENFVEAIGVLGWLDAVVPAGAVDLWLIALGALIAVALIAGARRLVVWALVLAGTTAATAWILELLQGNTSGTYWQGRYSLPLLVGVPLLLAVGAAERSDASTDEATDETARGTMVIRLVGAAGLLIANIGAWSAGRRFGVGTDGPLSPWHWDTPIQPIPPIVLVFAHAAVSIWLAALVLRPSRADRTAG